MKFNLQYITDVHGNNYVGIDVPKELVAPYLNQLEQYLGKDVFEEYYNNKNKRDRGKFHITVINVMSFNKLTKERGIDYVANEMDKIFNIDITDVKLLGVGQAKKNENTAYFIAVKSELIQEIRKKYGMPEIDLHITLGFKWKDVFDVRKNEVMDFSNNFIRRLSSEYKENGESFEFIKYVSNFDGDDDSEIEPISIDDSGAIFRFVGTNKYFRVSLLEPQGFYITSKWEDITKLPYMSSNLVLKKLSDNS